MQTSKAKSSKKDFSDGLIGTGEIVIEEGSKHSKIEHIRSGKKYTIPTSHNVVNKYIIKGFMKWLVERKVCTQDEFNKHI